MNEITPIQPIDLTTVASDDTQALTHFAYDAIRLADRVNHALGETDLSTDTLKSETIDLYALQQLALLYAEHVLHKTDWINLHRYVAQLAVSEGAQSAWQWQAMDLMSFALSDYLADAPNAGDALLHEMMVLTRQGAADRLHDAYRQRHVNAYDDLRDALAHGRLDQDNTLDDLCTAVVAQRSSHSADPRTPS